VISMFCTYWCQGKPTLRGGCGRCCGKGYSDNVLKDIEHENEQRKQEIKRESVRNTQPSPTAEMKETLADGSKTDGQSPAADSQVEGGVRDEDS